VDVRLREWLNYDYKSPKVWLQTLQEMELAVVHSGLPYKVRALRTHALRRWSETRHAALFAYGMSQRMPNYQFDFACCEAADYDAVVRWRRGNEQVFAPIQLKEFVPEELNRGATLEKLFCDLSRYSDSSDLVVVVLLNRRFTLAPGPIHCAPLRLGGVYLVGAITSDQSKWCLIGDLLDRFGHLSVFAHP